MKMKISEMNRKQLLKVAARYNLTSDGLDDKALRAAIVAAKREPVEVEAPGDITKLGKAGWPKVWSSARRQKYYRAICGKSLGDETAETYRELLRRVEQTASEPFAPRLIRTGDEDCYGVAFSESLKACVEDCDVMPQCRAICAAHPADIQHLEALAEASAEASALGDAEVAEIAEEAAIEKAAPKKKAKKAKVEAEPVEEQPVQTAKVAKAKKKTSSVEAYSWSVEAYSWKDFASALDKDILAIYKWAEKRGSRGFTPDELASQYETRGYDGLASATGMVEYLLDCGAIVAM